MGSKFEKKNWKGTLCEAFRKAKYFLKPKTRFQRNVAEITLPLTGVIATGVGTWKATHALGGTALMISAASLLASMAYANSVKKRWVQPVSTKVLKVLAVATAGSAALCFYAACLLLVHSVQAPERFADQARESVRNDILAGDEAASYRVFGHNTFTGVPYSFHVNGRCVDRSTDGGLVLIRYGDGENELNNLVERPNRTKYWERIPLNGTKAQP